VSLPFTPVLSACRKILETEAGGADSLRKSLGGGKQGYPGSGDVLFPLFGTNPSLACFCFPYALAAPQGPACDCDFDRSTSDSAIVELLTSFVVAPAEMLDAAVFFETAREGATEDPLVSPSPPPVREYEPEPDEAEIEDNSRESPSDFALGRWGGTPLPLERGFSLGLD